MFSRRLTKKGNHTPVRLHDTKEEPEEGRFPSSVGSDEGRKRPSGDLQRHTFQDRAVSVGEPYVLKLQDRALTARTGH
jgi:hypothetical protein